MKIAVDLDGVCYEWSRTAMYMLKHYCGHTFDLPESDSWNYIQENVSEESWEWLWTDGVRLGLFRYGHMVTGARMGLQNLVADGHKIEIVTHRPASAIGDTLDWVSLYFKDIPLAGMHLLTNGESKTISDADLLIDDKPENIMDFVDAGRRGLLFVRPWNENWGAETIRVYGWPDVPRKVMNLAAKQSR